MLLYSVTQLKTLNISVFRKSKTNKGSCTVLLNRNDYINNVVNYWTLQHFINYTTTQYKNDIKFIITQNFLKCSCQFGPFHLL